MTHCDVIALLLHCKPMEIGKFCKFVANIFQNGSRVLRTIVLTAFNNPLSVLVATILPSLITVIWIVRKSGTTCTKTASPRCLGIGHSMLMPSVNYWAFVMVHIYMFHPLMKLDILLTTFVCIKILRLFIMYHLLSYTRDIWHSYLFKLTSIHCHSMCFYCFIYPYTYVILIYVFYCTIFTCNLCANKDTYISVKHNSLEYVPTRSARLDLTTRHECVNTLLSYSQYGLIYILKHGDYYPFHFFPGLIIIYSRGRFGFRFTVVFPWILPGKCLDDLWMRCGSQYKFSSILESLHGSPGELLRLYLTDVAAAKLSNMNVIKSIYQWPLSLTWFNFHPIMDKYSHVQLNVRWNYSSISKLQWLHRWSLGIDK